VEPEYRIHKIRAAEWGKKRSDFLKEYRASRDQKRAREAIMNVTEAMKSTTNMIPVIMDALKAKVTMGEIHQAMRDAYGFKIEM
jgi:methylmalonyl-CoA mutase N-terminal domain/subunit